MATSAIQYHRRVVAVVQQKDSEIASLMIQLYDLKDMFRRQSRGRRSYYHHHYHHHSNSM